MLQEQDHKHLFCFANIINIHIIPRNSIRGS